MSAIEQTYEKIIAYLKGLLSNRQRHDLEKRMMQDVFDEEAFEGLGQMTAEELQTDMDLLAERLQQRIKPVRKRYLMPVLRIAAAVVLLTGIAGILYVILRSPSQELITQEIPKKEKPAPEMAAPSVAQPAEKDIEPSGSSVEPKDISSEKQAKTEVLAYTSSYIIG